MTDDIETLPEQGGIEDGWQLPDDQVQDIMQETEKPIQELKPAKTVAWKMITVLSLGGIALLSVAAILWTKLRKNTKNKN